MKKLLLIFTFLLLFPLKAFASCDNFGSGSVTRSNSAVTYIKNDGTSNTPVVAHGSPLVMTNVKQINRFEQYINFKAQGNYVYFTFDISLESSHFRMIKNLPAPRIFPVSSGSDSLYCSYIYYSSNDNTTSTIDNISQSPAPSTYFQTYNFVLECPVHQNWDTSSVSNYRLVWELYFGLNYSNSDYSLNADYQLLINVAQNYGYSFDSCSNDEIISNLGDIQNSIIDINDSITDTDISNSVTELESQLEDWGVNYHGVAGFVTAPLSFITSLANQQACTPISLPPILGNTSSTFVLPCFMEEFEDRFPSLFAIYQIAIYFFVCYRIGIDCFKLIQKLKDPLNDEISVADI